ncbi:MAG: protoporphyrinogen oxidase HemJ [Nitratireductor sp.]|nr:protoporphyrinogen oxidase HemJ [Nitratireductor sp.]
MYEWAKVAHLVSVISWMVGFLYLPRLMVYHNESEPGSETSETFKVMERRLLKAIMTPAMVASWGFGLWLMVLIGAWSFGWFVSKLFLVVILTAFHGFAAKWVAEFAADRRTRQTRFYRIVNEVPAAIMVLIVILVIVKPF